MTEEQWTLSVRIARNGGDLLQHRQTWGRLVERAAEPNFFFEPEPFLAALDHQPPDEPLCAVLVYANPPKRQKSEPSLVGFIPFQRVSDRRLALLDQYSLHCHAYCFLCTPLIDLDFVPEVIGILFDWMASVPDGVRIFNLNKIGSDGRIWQTLTSGLTERNLPHFVRGGYQRALFRRRTTPAEQVRSSIGAKRRKELRRLRNRLEERGNLALRVFQGDDSVEAWTTQFLTLESGGWKGGSAHALAHSEDQRRYFKRLTREAQANGTLIMLSLDLDGRAIAQKCSFRSVGRPESAFAFKIAYDEEFSRFSPGVQLEIENIRLLHEIHPAVDWMDSCAGPEHPMIDHLWRDRRGIADVVCGGPDTIARGLMWGRRMLRQTA